MTKSSSIYTYSSPEINTEVVIPSNPLVVYEIRLDRFGPIRKFSTNIKGKMIKYTENMPLMILNSNDCPYKHNSMINFSTQYNQYSGLIYIGVDGRVLIGYPGLSEPMTEDDFIRFEVIWVAG